MSVFKAENIRLKEKITTLEDRVLGMVAAVKILPGGMPGKEHIINNNIAEIITTENKIKIVAPYITTDYAHVLIARASQGVEIQMVINDRKAWPKEFENLYTKLKQTNGINLINNPNVQYLAVTSENSAIITSGPLDKDHLMKTVLIATFIQEKRILKELDEIFKEMLPSFMR